jgi:hypothetical protein
MDAEEIAVQRKATKNTRGPSTIERRLLVWVKQQPCCICNAPGPSIADHCYGATMRNKRVLIGMWAILPYCPTCDAVKTRGSHRAHLSAFGKTQADLWLNQLEMLPTTLVPSSAVIEAIRDWGR